MKKKFAYGILGMLFIVSSCKKAQDNQELSQETIINSKQENLQKLAFSIGNLTYKYNAQAANLDKPTPGVASAQQSPGAAFIDNIAYNREQIPGNLKISESFEFYQGMQSPHNANIWVYLERKIIGASYNLYQYNALTGQKTILISEENPERLKLAFRAIGWTKDANKLYLEGLYLDSSTEHEGIWVYDLDKKSSSQIALSVKLMGAPILTPDREKFILLGSTSSKHDPLHGTADLLTEFDVVKKSYQTLINAKGENVLIQGWLNQGNEIKKAHSPMRTSAVDYYLPWDNGRTYCVSRHGIPAPSGTHTYVSACTGVGGAHTYAAVDFDTPNNADHNVRAAQAGTVTVSGWASSNHSASYGQYVVIRHSDGTYSYYAHNKTLLVSVGQVVTQGQIISIEGTTGDSTGDHIHFEFRNSSGTRFTGAFKDRGQPRGSYSYNSNNIAGPPPVPGPAGTFDDFNTGVGRFYSQPTATITTVGVSTTSTADWFENVDLRVIMNDDASVTTPWKVRLLSGGGAAANNVLLPKTGKVWFHAITSTAQPGATVKLFLDDSDGTEQTPSLPVAPAGVWHKYEWDLATIAVTRAFPTLVTDHALTAPNVTLDAIVMEQPNTATQWKFYIDNVGKN